MTTIPTTTSSTRPGSPSAGDAYFETDTKNYIIYDGANWRGYANDGITFGDNSYVAELNGTDQYLTLGDVSGTLGGVSKCTISFWWKHQGTANEFRRLFTMNDFQIDRGGMFCFWNTNYWVIYVGSGTTLHGLRTPAYPATTTVDSNWHMYTFVYDGTQSTNTNRIKFYIDKNEQTMGVETGVIPTTLASTTGEAPYLGAAYNTDPNDSNPDVYGYSQSSFDDFAIFNDALTSTQVANIYDNQIYPTSLQHLYRMENNVNDSVGSANGTAPNGGFTTSPSIPQFPY